MECRWGWRPPPKTRLPPNQATLLCTRHVQRAAYRCATVRSLNFFSRWRNARKLRRHALPEALWQEALAALPFLASWPQGELEALRRAATLFLCEKNIVGVHGLEVSPFQRVVVAIQACMPVLKLGLSSYDNFKTVLLCPGEFSTEPEWEDEDGIIHRDEEPVMGETMPGGPVLLSWPDTLEFGSACGAPAPINLVIHEFVHKLDMKNGEANGCPPLPKELSAERWQKTMACAYEDFCRRVEEEEEVGIDAYAAEEPAEFFAVLSETFFVAPGRLRETYPEVYECLRLLYRFG